MLPCRVGAQQTGESRPFPTLWNLRSNLRVSGWKRVLFSLPDRRLRDTPLKLPRVFPDHERKIFRQFMIESAEQVLLYSVERQRRVACGVVLASEPSGFRRKFLQP